MSKPRFQSLSFVLPDLDGSTLEQLLGFANDEGEPIVLFLKASGHHWQRFFLDAGSNFWVEVEEEQALDELSEEPTVDFGTRLGVVGQTIGIIEADDTPRIRIPLTAGDLVFEAIDRNVLDAPVRLRFVPR